MLLHLTRTSQKKEASPPFRCAWDIKFTRFGETEAGTPFFGRNRLKCTRNNYINARKPELATTEHRPCALVVPWHDAASIAIRFYGMHSIAIERDCISRCSRFHSGLFYFYRSLFHSLSTKCAHSSRFPHCCGAEIARDLLPCPREHGG